MSCLINIDIFQKVAELLFVEQLLEHDVGRAARHSHFVRHRRLPSRRDGLGGGSVDHAAPRRYARLP